MSKDYRIVELEDLNEAKDSKIKVLEAKLEAANLRTESLEKLGSLFATIEMDNQAMMDHMQIALTGLREIEQIKGSPPLGVAQTIASRTIKEIHKSVMELSKDHEDETNPSNNGAIHAGPDSASEDSEHEAGNLPGRIG